MPHVFFTPPASYPTDLGEAAELAGGELSSEDIKGLRERFGRTQAQMGAVLGVGRIAYWRYEKEGPSSLSVVQRAALRLILYLDASAWEERRQEYGHPEYGWPEYRSEHAAEREHAAFREQLLAGGLEALLAQSEYDHVVPVERAGQVPYGPLLEVEHEPTQEAMAGLREALLWRQVEMGRFFGVAQSTITTWELDPPTMGLAERGALRALAREVLYRSWTLVHGAWPHYAKRLLETGVAPWLHLRRGGPGWLTQEDLLAESSAGSASGTEPT